jgi:hypothetical protein
MAGYESKQMELVQANSSAVQVPYVGAHKNASVYWNVLCTADLDPTDKLISIYKWKTNKHIRVDTQVYIYIYIYIYINGRAIRYV